MLRGYETSWNQGSCPTEAYLFGTRQGKVWTEFDFYNPNSSQLIKNVSDRYSLTLGLPVSQDEYYTTDEWLKSTNKMNF